MILFLIKSVRYIKNISTMIFILFSAIAITACTEERKAQELFDSAELDIQKLSYQSTTYFEAYLYSKNAIQKIDDIVNQFPGTQLAKELNTNDKFIAEKTLAQLKELNKILNKEKEQEADLFYLATKVNESFEGSDDINGQLNRKTSFAISLHSFDEIEKAKITLAEAEKLADYLIDLTDKRRAYTDIANAYIDIGDTTKANYIADEKIRKLDESNYPLLGAYLGVKANVAISLYHKKPDQAQKLLLDLSNEVDDFNSESGFHEPSNRIVIDSIFDAYLKIGDNDSALAIARKNNGNNMYYKLAKLTKAYIADDELVKANKLVEHNDQDEYKALAMVELSKAYTEKGDQNKGIEILLEAYKLAENIKLNKYDDISEVYSAVNKAKLMIEIAGRFLRIDESLRASQIFDRARELVKSYTPIYTSEILAHTGAQYYKSGDIEKGNSLLIEAFIDAKLETRFKGSAFSKIFEINLELLRFEEALSILQDRATPVDNRAYLFLDLAEKAAEKNQLGIVSSAISELLQNYNISSVHPRYLASYFFRMAKIVKEKNIELTDDQKSSAAYLLIKYSPIEKLLSDKTLVTEAKL